MIRMFRLFRTSPIMAPSISYWDGGDALIMELATSASGSMLKSAERSEPQAG